jgi:hypothetical protein
MRKLCEKVAAFCDDRERSRAISTPDYMMRYYLFHKSKMKDKEKPYGWNAFLHDIRGSDEPFYHDHPWDYTTVILSGGYWEHTPVLLADGTVIGDRKTFYGPGSVLRRKANHFHYLERGPNGSTWTLFMHSKRLQEWGFLPFGESMKVSHSVWTEQRRAQGFAR